MSAESADGPERGKTAKVYVVHVVGKRATNEEWRVYYERAAELRATAGDPFKRHLQREALRERILVIGSVVFILATIGAFCLFTMW
jgi:hypothetical protein